MADLFDRAPATLQQPNFAASGGRRLSANGRPIGRPPGARNKGSLQLGKYLEARFGGMTPGQQAAEIAMATPKDLKRASAMAKELGLVDLGLDAMTLALVVKAEQLARALGCTRTEAWELLRRERAELYKYVHQAQPPAKESTAAPPATVFLVPEGEAHQALAASIGELDDDDLQDPDFAGVVIEHASEVGQPKSDDEA